MTQPLPISKSVKPAENPRGSGLLSRLIHGRTILHSTPDWPDFVGENWDQRIMAEEVTDRLHVKQGRSIARWTLTSDNGLSLVVFLKRHYVLPRRHGWLAALFPGSAWSPGLEEWEHLEWAKTAGIPVPRAVAVAEWLEPWGKLSGFLAVEELHDMLPLHEAIPLAHQRLNPTEFATWKRGLIAELARLTRELHRRRAFHKDLYLCHFYIAASDTALSPASWPGRVVMIDFHRLGLHRFTWGWWAVKDLAQLLYSSDVPGVTARDRVRFWKLYRAGDWGTATPTPRWVRSGVVVKWRIYERQKARRAARKMRTE